MDESSYLDPAALQAQCGGAIQVLESDKEAIYILENSLDSFINDGEIQGASFAAMKQQISDYKTVLQAIVTAHESDKMDFEALKGAAVGEVLDGSKIIPNKKKAKESQEEYERRAEQYRSMASSCPPALFLLYSYYMDIASACSKLAEIERRLYEKWKEKEETYDAIEAATSGLFSASGGMRAAIDSALSGINGAFCVAEGRYEIDWRAPWRGEISTAKSRLIEKQLNLMGIEPERVQELTDMGFTYDGLWGYRLMCQNEQEKEFYIQVLLGTEESVRKIMEFNNAVLQSEAYCVDESDQITMRKYRDVYIEKLFGGTYLRLEEMGLRVGTVSSDDWNCAKLEREYVENRAMLLLWNTEGIVIKKLENVYEAEDQRCCILNLNFKDNVPAFTMEHYSPWNSSMISEKIVTLYRENSNTGGYLQKAIEYKELQEQQKNICRNFLQSLVIDTGMMALTMYMPEAAIPLSILMMALDGKAGTVAGLDSLATNDIGKFEIKAGNILTKDVINSYSNWSNIQDKMDRLDDDTYFDLFGSYMGYTILDGEGVLDAETAITMKGICDPNIIRRKMLWENQGMGAWINFGDDTEEEIIQKVEQYTDENSDNIDVLVEDMKTLLRGEKGMFETMPMERFNLAMDGLDQIIKGNDIKTQFFSFTD